MAIFRGKIPVTIHPFFWLVAAIIGFFNSYSFVGTLIWVAVIFVSILVHEYGHALMALAFKCNPRIELVGMGGLTYHDSAKLPYWKQFLIVLFGPLFSFFLFLIFAFLLTLPTSHTIPLVAQSFLIFKWVNLFWTIVNLIPVLPLDGGQLLRIVLERLLGPRGQKYAFGISVGLGTVLGIYFLVIQWFLIGAIFLFFAFQAFQMWKMIRPIDAVQKNPPIRSAFEDAEKALESGNKEQAMEQLEKVLQETGRGVLYNVAAQNLAMLKFEEGDKKRAYELLLPIKESLASDVLCILHQLAYEMGNFTLVLELSGKCFQIAPFPEIALRSAYAAAEQGLVGPAVGWLQSAVDEGLINPKEITEDPIFDKVRKEDPFQNFLSNL